MKVTQKWLSVLLVLVLLLGALAGCTVPDVTEPTDNPETSAGPYYYGEGLPITEEEERMITEAYWERYLSDPYYLATGEFYETDLAYSAEDLSIRLMGHFGDAYVFFVDGYQIIPPVWSIIRFGDYEVKCPTVEMLWVYYEENLYSSVQYTYELGILTDDDLTELQANIEELLVFPEPPELEERIWPDGLENEIWGAYAAYRAANNSIIHTPEYYKLVYGGNYNGATVFFCHEIEDTHYREAILCLDYRGVEFPILVDLCLYYNGEVHQIHEAYSDGFMSMEDILDLQEYYIWFVNGLFEDELYMEWYIDWQNGEWHWGH